jgi:hypothetical protein
MVFADDRRATRHRGARTATGRRRSPVAPSRVGSIRGARPPGHPGQSRFFFDGGDRAERLSGYLYLPSSSSRRTAVVVVPALGRERLRIYHESSNLARQLAAAGHPVLRFDPRGEGESDCEFAASTVATRVEDTGAAGRELRRRAGTGEVELRAAADAMGRGFLRLVFRPFLRREDEARPVPGKARGGFWPKA